ncbi:MAG: SET domain-containing protein [archaeon]
MTIYIDNAPGKGRGVFAAKDFRKGDTIEVCPVIVLPAAETSSIDDMALSDYCFEWNDKGDLAICLGYGSLYNHSKEPNAKFYTDHGNSTILFKAEKDIRKGEEITHDYEWDLDEESTPDWFKKMYR